MLWFESDVRIQSFRTKSQIRSQIVKKRTIPGLRETQEMERPSGAVRILFLHSRIPGRPRHGLCHPILMERDLCIDFCAAPGVLHWNPAIDFRFSEMAGNQRKNRGSHGRFVRYGQIEWEQNPGPYCDSKGFEIPRK